MKLIQQLVLLTEGKRKKDLSYDTVPLKKGGTDVDKVIVKLDGAKSAAFTVLAKKYRALKTELEELTAQLDGNRSELRAKMEEMFDPSDELATRIVETCQLTLQLAKAVQPSSKEETDYKKAYDSIVEQLSEMVPDLQEQIKNVATATVKANTVVKSVAGKQSAFTIKEGVMEVLTSLYTKAKAKLQKWLASYDKKLDNVKADMEELKTLSP